MAAPNCFLSLDLIEVILYRCPLESLLRFKSISKEWYNLINDNRFICNLIDQSPEKFIRNHKDQVVCILDPVDEFLSVSTMPMEFRGYRIYKMVHCDGLMLCICIALRYSPTKLRSLDLLKLAVWNPFLMEMKWIEPETRYYGTVSFGIGYDKNSRGNYKILRLSGPLTDIELPDTEYEIYEPIKSDSWRSIDANFDGLVESECGGVSVKGNMYWIAVKKKKIRFILSFDFSSETFNETCVCPTYGTERLGCFSGDRLSLLQQDETRKIHVWVTNKLSDRSVSFSKYFDVAFPNLPMLRTNYVHPGYFIGKHKNIMAWCEIDVHENAGWYVGVTLFEIDEGKVVKRIETGQIPHVYSVYYSVPITCGYVYVPSLVPVPR